MLITDLCLFGFSVRLRLVLIATLCLFRSPVGVIGLILVFWILYLYYETHTSISELILIRKLSRPSDPGPTRLVDPNRSPGRDAIYTIYILYCTGTLIDLFFLRAVLCTCSIQTISVITKKSFIYTKELPPEWCPSKSIHIYRVPFTYTDTISITKLQRLRKQRW